MEFNAVIFCGRGHNLGPLTGKSETSLPKALLPLANRPMVEYVLEWCDKAPFKSITLLCDTASERAIKDAITKYETGRESAGCVIKTSGTDATTTGAAIAQLFPNNEGESYVILPCDFITDVPPQVLIEMYRKNNDENIGMSVFYKNSFDNIDKKVLKRNYTLYSNDVLLDMYSKDFVAFDKFLKVRTQLLWRYPSTNVSTKLLDSFIFFVSSGLKQVSSEVPMNRSITKIKRDLARRSWKHSHAESTIGLFALPEKATFLRCNNLPMYMEGNRHILNGLARSGAQSKPQTKEKNEATVGADCIIGENSKLGERTSVKKSAIGANCSIGKKCRISNCVLLDGVKLGDNVQLENCILGKDVQMAGNSRLVNCNVEGGYAVGSDVDLKGENLQGIDLVEMGLQMSDSDGGKSGESSEESSSEGDDSSFASYDEEDYEGEDFFARN